MLLKRAATLGFLVAAGLLINSSADAGPRNFKSLAAPSSENLELDGCDLPTVLKMLGREAHVPVILEPQISGSISMRLEDVNARQAIDILAQAYRLNVQEVKGICYVKTTPETDAAHKGGKSSDDALSSAFGDAFSQGLIKVYDASLDYMAKPQTAERMAKQKRNYYLALVKEGFTAEEALKIVTFGSGLEPLSGDSKSK